MRLMTAILAVSLAVGSGADVVVTRSDPSLPDGCRPGQVARLVNGFFAAFNEGRPDAAGFVALGHGAQQRWYSVSEGDPRRGGRHFVTFDPVELSAYLAERHLHGDRLRLRQLIVGYANGLGQIEYVLRRRADDLRAAGVTTSRVHGKGAIDCRRRKIVAWSMAMSDSLAEHPLGRLCPRPAHPTRAAVACARRWRRQASSASSSTVSERNTTRANSTGSTRSPVRIRSR